MFTKASTVPKLPVDALARQNRIAHLACSLFGDSRAAIAYLNLTHEALGGRPLDIATVSESGYLAVEQSMRNHVQARMDGKP